MCVEYISHIILYNSHVGTVILKTSVMSLFYDKCYDSFPVASRDNKVPVDMYFKNSV